MGIGIFRDAQKNFLSCTSIFWETPLLWFTFVVSLLRKTSVAQQTVSPLVSICLFGIDNPDLVTIFKGCLSNWAKHKCYIIFVWVAWWYGAKIFMITHIDLIQLIKNVCVCVSVFLFGLVAKTIKKTVCKPNWLDCRSCADCYKKGCDWLWLLCLQRSRHNTMVPRMQFACFVWSDVCSVWFCIGHWCRIYYCVWNKVCFMLMVVHRLMRLKNLNLGNGFSKQFQQKLF